jgi:organic hydroperoxide reductase OsmC/OhrA
MSEYRARLQWTTTASPFRYETYSRAHTVTFGSGTTMQASAAPDYLGDTDRVNPEEAFLGALSSCHMLTFLAIAAKKGWVVESYDDDASCTLEKEAGGLSVQHATLSPRVVFAGTEVTPEALAAAHASAHRNCFIARSVKTEIAIKPRS